VLDNDDTTTDQTDQNTSEATSPPSATGVDGAGSGTAEPAKKAAAKKATKAPAKKAAAKKAPAKKAPAKAAPVAKKAPATKAAPAKKASPVAAKAAATQAPAKKVPAKKAPARAASAAKLVVLEQEDPWTKAELNEVKKTLTDDVKRLTGELVEVEEDLAGMIANSGEGAGNDQADVGSASFERDQEMVIVNNARDMLEQSQHALERIADGTYGQCEICGNPIGKARLMAFPRATLCLTCKQREERR
jgi:RNA polymerase-binding protein DksA